LEDEAAAIGAAQVQLADLDVGHGHGVGGAIHGGEADALAGAELEGTTDAPLGLADGAAAPPPCSLSGLLVAAAAELVPTVRTRRDPPAVQQV
jgi:hypothetical protein